MHDLTVYEIRQAVRRQLWDAAIRELHDDRSVLLDRKRNKGLTKAETRLLKHLEKEINWYEMKEDEKRRGLVKKDLGRLKKLVATVSVRHR